MPDDPDLALRLLGELEASDARGRSVLPRGRKARALLAILALAAPATVARARLCQLLWPSRGHEQARASLRQAVRELQAALEPSGEVRAGAGLLASGRTHLALRAGALSLDVQRLLGATPARPHDLALLRGPLLAELEGLEPAFDAWLGLERARILAAAAALAAEVAREGDPATAPAIAAGAAEAVLRQDRTLEAAWRALMQARARHDPAAAAATLAECAAALAATGRPPPSAETRALAERLEGAAPAVAAEERRLRLGVMPFRALDPGAAELALGLAEEITTALARFRWLSCISSLSLAALDAARLGPGWAALGLDFVLEGSAQRGADRVRVTVRLLDLRAGAEVVWARRFDRALTDLLSLQEELASLTVAQLDPELMAREGDRAVQLRRTAADPSAYLMLLAAIPPMCRLQEAEFRRAGELLAHALELDPDHAGAHSWWAYWHLLLVGQGWAPDPAAARERCWALTRRAIQLDPMDARALAVAGHVEAFMHHRLEAAHALHERALAANPNLPLAWAFSGLAHVYEGRHGEGLRRLDQARALSPLDPHGFLFESGLMLGRLMLGEDAAVAQLGRTAIPLNPAFTSTRKVQLAALGHLGAVAEAAAMRAELLQLEPGFDVAQAMRRSPLLREADRGRYAAGLRLAGLD